MAIECRWRGDVESDEVNALHAEAFETRLFTTEEWNWLTLLANHSLGWVTAREGNRLVGFVNVIWDGIVHAWIQDTMVSADFRGRRIGTNLVDVAKQEARKAGCEWLHVDFEDHLGSFYYEACGFLPTSGGLIRLNAAD